MVQRQIFWLNLFFIFVISLICSALIFPKYFNQGIDWFNTFQFSFFNFQLKIPRLPELPFKLGLDLQGGSQLIYEVKFQPTEDLTKKEKTETLQGLRDVIERRVNLFGVKEPLVRIEEKTGRQRLIVELPGIKNIKEAIEMIGKTPYLEFREEREEKEIEEEIEKILEGLKKDKELKIEELDEEKIKEQLRMNLYFKPTELTGKYLKKSVLIFDETTFEPTVSLEFNSEGAKIFKELTTKNINKRLAIFIDNVLISAPTVKEAIPGGKAVITGKFTLKEAQELVRNLNAGALPVPIELIAQNTIGPTLGKISLEKSLRAGITGFLAIFIFMILFYRLPGLLSSLSLLIYCLILLSLFKLIPVTLTLAGIAGFILSVGMAIDANILIFERKKEELKEGENLIRAVEKGFSRSWLAIRDGNVTTLLAAFIMFFFGTSFIKGFALILSLGILISLFSALFITKTFLKIFVSTKLSNIKWLWI